MDGWIDGQMDRQSTSD